jgi:hypothetical protein
LSLPFNSVDFSATAAGTGAFGIGAARAGGRTPATAAVADGDAVSYRAESSDKTQWEDGHGTYHSAGPTISRDAVLANSNHDASAVNFTAAPRVFLTYLAEDVEPVLLSNGSISVAAPTFDLLLPGSYSLYLLKLWRMTTDGRIVSNLRFSSDGGVTFHAGANDYQYAASDPGGGNSGPDGGIRIGHFQGAIGAAGMFELTIDPGTPSLFASITSRALVADYSDPLIDGIYPEVAAGSYLAVGRQNAIRLYDQQASASNFTGGRYRLLGIR